MINALLDPNQIPVVRAIERRSGETAQRAFEPGFPSAAVYADNPLQIELHTHDTQGEARHIAFAWTPAAGADMASPTTPWAMSTQAFLLTQMAGPSFVATPVVPVSTPPVPPPLTTAEPLTGATPTAADAGAPWQQRWLQWLQEGHNAELQVRLRDYRLLESDYPRLIEQLHHLTREQGLTLTRLMVNGRELWRLPATETGVSHGR